MYVNGDAFDIHHSIFQWLIFSPGTHKLTLYPLRYWPVLTKLSIHNLLVDHIHTSLRAAGWMACRSWLWCWRRRTQWTLRRTITVHTGHHSWRLCPGTQNTQNPLSTAAAWITARWNWPGRETQWVWAMLCLWWVHTYSTHACSALIDYKSIIWEQISLLK